MLFDWVYLRDDGGSTMGAEIGEPFSLVGHHGKAVTEGDYLGKPTLVFFPFTNCQNVCPSTLPEMTEQLKELGPDADRLNVMFITVDPERDTPQPIALYRSSFDPRVPGLTGTPENISVAEKAYHIYAKKIPLEDGEYTKDHTATIAVMNSKGQYVDALHYQAPNLPRARNCIACWA
jgi:protein SCO1/2